MAEEATWKCWRDASHPTRPNPLLGWPQCTVCSAAPPYHERPSYLPPGFHTNLYVPQDQTSALRRYVAGSAIVGITEDSEDENARVRIYYEGWIYHRPSVDPFDSWRQGVIVAADRLITSYPTAAMAWVSPKTLTKIGTYSPAGNVFTITDPTARDEWLAAGITDTPITL